MTEPALKLSGLSCAYLDSLVLQQVDLSVPEGVVAGIVGPNGAGKSTLLKAAVGLIPPVTGVVEFFGEPLSRVRQKIGYMRQSSSVDWDFPTTVQDVVLMGTYGKLGWLRRPRAAERAAAMHALERVGIAELASRPIGQLSGGERQRTFLARVLAQDPEVFLLDEPFAGVDAASQRAISRVLHGLRDEGRTVIVVHHDLSDVPRLCDWTALINRRVVSAGPTAEAFSEDHVRLAYGLVAA